MLVMCLQMSIEALIGSDELSGLLFGFYGISKFIDYLTPNSFLWKLFYFKQFSLA